MATPTYTIRALRGRGLAVEIPPYGTEATVNKLDEYVTRAAPAGSYVAKLPIYWARATEGGAINAKCCGYGLKGPTAGSSASKLAAYIVIDTSGA